MHVPQLPASQEKGGAKPARRALSSSVSPGFGETDAVLPSRWMVTVAVSVSVTVPPVCGPVI